MAFHSVTNTTGEPNNWKLVHLANIGASEELVAQLMMEMPEVVDFPLFQRMALPVMAGKTKIAGIKIHHTRMMRLMEVLLHGGTQLDGWRSADIHHVILKTFGLSAATYTLTQLRYDLRKMKAHGLLERIGRGYRYRLTDKGVKAALMFILFHKRVCGPLADSLFHHRPNETLKPTSKVETAYHNADHAIQKVVDLLAA
jgi:hypothetical protein